jgi:maleate isomerase
MLPVYSATHGVLHALDAMGVRKIGVVTPFDDAANENVRGFYRGRGFEVVSIVGLDRPGFDEIASTSDEETRRACELAAADAIDALVQVGTGLPMLHLVESLEAHFGLPVISSNAAAYWSALRGAWIKHPVSGRGQLFAKF